MIHGLDVRLDLFGMFVDPWTFESRRRRLVAELTDRTEREDYQRQLVTSALASQISALRNSRGLTQAQVAQRLGKPQSVLSRLEGGGYGRYTVGTLLELALMYDVGLLLAFVPFSELVDREAAAIDGPHAVPAGSTT